jgi:hypothetical protein
MDGASKQSPPASLALLHDAMDKRHTSIDLLSLRQQMVQANRDAKRTEATEKKKTSAAAQQEKKKVAKAAKEAKAAKDAEPKDHTMIRRSQLQEIMDKPRPTNDERQALMDHLGVSKCFHCQTVKAVSEFYRRKTRRVGIETICSDCIYDKFNLDPRRNYLRLMYNHCKSRAKTKSFEFDLVQQDLHDLYDRQNGLCALSTQPMSFIYKRKRGKREFIRHPTNSSLDRIDPSRGYTKDNIQMTTNLCNHAKMDLTEEVFFRMCRQVVATADANGN